MRVTDDFHRAMTPGKRATGERMWVTCDGIAATAPFPRVMIRKNSATLDGICVTPQRMCVTGDKKCVTDRKKPVTSRKKPAQLDKRRVTIRTNEVHFWAKCITEQRTRGTPRRRSACDSNRNDVYSLYRMHFRLANESCHVATFARRSLVTIIQQLL